MPRESLVTDTMVQRVALDWRGQEANLSGSSSLEAVTAILAQFLNLPAGRVFVIYGCAHELVLPHPANPKQGTQWTPIRSGGGTLKLVLARVDEPAQRVHLEYTAYAEQGEIGVDEPTSWLGVGFNPTTIPIGNNVLPVTIADPATGEFDEMPSSLPSFLIAANRMGLHLLPELARQAGLTNGDLFSDRTLQAIKDGDVHVTRCQWAGYLPAAVLAFLQLLVTLYDQTIARRDEIIQLATHLRFKFKRFPDTGPLNGVMLQRHQGNKLQYSITFYNKAAEVARMRQGRTLTRLEDAIIRRHVRLDVSVHSAGVLTLGGEAQRCLPQLLKKHPKYLDAASAQRFLNEKPRPTVWWLERSVGILSHTTTDFSRQSFGSWLIPEMLREVLKLDIIAGFTAADFDAMLRQDDEVVVAWRETERVEDDWAGALAQAAGCSKGWVYERRKQLLAKCKIDIKIPFAYYRDLVFFGPNSFTKPKVRAALNAALARGDAATNLRLRQKAAKDFERRRITVGGGTVRSPPLLMSPKVVTQTLGSDQSGVGRAVPSLAARSPGVGAVRGGSLIANGISPPALNLSGGTPAGARGQGADVPQLVPTKQVTNPSRGQEVRRPVPHRPAQPASSGAGSVSLRRAEVMKIILLLMRSLRAKRTPPPSPPPPSHPPTGKIVLGARLSPTLPYRPTGRIILRGRRSPPPQITRRVTPDR
jgi:hypothetical protein